MIAFSPSITLCRSLALGEGPGEGYLLDRIRAATRSFAALTL
jgi:hypothetical protein